MDIHELRMKQAHEGYGNLGDDNHGLQKVANDATRADVLKEFSAEMDTHDAKRLPASKSPIHNLRTSPNIENVQEEEHAPLDFDERMRRFLRD